MGSSLWCNWRCNWETHGMNRARLRAELRNDVPMEWSQRNFQRPKLPKPECVWFNDRRVKKSHLKKKVISVISKYHHLPTLGCHREPVILSYLLSSPATAKLEICLCNLLVSRLSRLLRWWVKTLVPKRYPKMADGWENNFPSKKNAINWGNFSHGQILLDLLDPSRCQKTQVMTENALCMWHIRHIVITYIVHSKSGGWSRLLCPAHRKAQESWHLPLCFVFQLS